jgi:hypothetical protein
LIVVISGCDSCSHRRPSGPSCGSDTHHKGSDGPGCAPDVCGLNGFWLGEGVPFRTLNLQRAVGSGAYEPNAEHLRISRFSIVKGTEEVELVPDVTGDALSGTSATGEVFTSTKLAGAMLTLEQLDDNNQSVVETYDLTITGVHTEKAWAKHPSDAMYADVPIYDFSARTHEGCDVRVCDPSLATDPSTGNIDGHAVIFQGDLYEDDNYQVTRAPDTKLVNIACLGTAISKMHMFRHTAAGAPTPGNPVPVDDEQALLRLMTGDYCGRGKPLTRNGTPIRIQVPGFVTNTGYAIPDPAHVTIDARWNDRGATCITTPRAMTLDKIVATCGHTFDRCPPTLGAGYVSVDP